MPTDNFEDAVLTAINFGGDSDTIGAITGGLAGCYYGYDNIPTRFIEAIPSDIKKCSILLLKLFQTKKISL